MTKLEYVRPAELRAEIGVCRGSVPRALAGRGPCAHPAAPRSGLCKQELRYRFYTTVLCPQSLLDNFPH